MEQQEIRKDILKAVYRKSGQGQVFGDKQYCNRTQKIQSPDS